MANYNKTMGSVGPTLVRIRQGIMSNVIVRNVFISAYAISNYESGFLSILMFVTATIMGNFVGI